MKKIAILLFTLVTIGYPHQIKVALLVYQPTHFQELIQSLNNDPRISLAYGYNIYDTLPPLSYIQQYDCIITDGEFEILYSEGLGNLLADYVDNGGYVVNLCFSMMGPYHYYGGAPTGRWWTDQYRPYGCTSSELNLGYCDMVIDKPASPIFDNVTGIFEVYSRIQTELRPGADELAHFSDAGGVALSADGNVVGINFTAVEYRHWTGDGFRLIANAVYYLAGYVAVEELSWGRIKTLSD
ncbi:MAG: hypothetical protein GF399_09390 [Candidatus Coatesbacteria bacterium]|nr:hypothetical protein [Candidatus Coatesbacteria bacterium]